MDEEVQKMLNRLTRRFMEIHEKETANIKLKEDEAVKLELLTAIYKTSGGARAFLILAMNMYARARLTGKTGILVDGVLKVGDIIFGGKENENP